MVRELINKHSDSNDPLYCCRVTANDGKLGEQHLKTFQDNEKTIPTILTTSRKLSTGVDAPEVRNIVLLRPCNNMIEFKQIIGRGTRLYEGKDYFTIYDFVDAYDNFHDAAWDADELPDPEAPTPRDRTKEEGEDYERKKDDREGSKRPKVIKIKLPDGKVRQIQSMTSTHFIGPDGRPLSAEEFITYLFGQLPEFYSSEQELRETWSKPSTRKALLDRLDEAGYGIPTLKALRELIAAPTTDLFDVLEYVSYAIDPLTRPQRAALAESKAYQSLTDAEKEFVEFVLSRYVETGVESLSLDFLPDLLEIKYEAIADASEKLGGIDRIRKLFIEFQKYLYERLAA